MLNNRTFVSTRKTIVNSFKAVKILRNTNFECCNIANPNIPGTATTARKHIRCYSGGLPIETTQVPNHLLAFLRLDNFVHPTLTVSLGRYANRRWSLLSGVCVRGRKRSHTDEYV